MSQNKQNQKFTTHERLKLRRRIDLIFEKGTSLNEFPLQVVYFVDDHAERNDLQVGFSVSKKFFKTAVARNRLKRLMREAYRKNKQNLKNSMNEKDSALYLMFIYKSKKQISYQEMTEKIFLLLQRLEKAVSK